VRFTPDPVVGRAAGLPSRVAAPSLAAFAVYLATAVFFVAALRGAHVSVPDLVAGLPNIGRLVADMLPPSPERLLPVGRALLETFQMAFVSTVFGVLLSVPLAIGASRSQTPGLPCYYAARSLISLFRTVPDLVWALLFVATVGLGPFAGTLALVVDSIGFCGRFFAEAMEEVDRGPQEALTALGASRAGTIFSAVLPAVLPSFINTTLFDLEKATRASVVLGLVGAGGIGLELKVAMDLFQYDQAATIILSVFALVLAVERLSAWLRRRII
jgi:phosphonate transport system permease protein